jgi:hypothetical protein
VRLLVDDWPVKAKNKDSDMPLHTAAALGRDVLGGRLAGGHDGKE